MLDKVHNRSGAFEVDSAEPFRAGWDNGSGGEGRMYNRVVPGGKTNIPA